jgi:hypothetical protein
MKKLVNYLNESVLNADMDNIAADMGNKAQIEGVLKENLSSI